MKLKKRRCANCRQWFPPDPRSIRGDQEIPCQYYCRDVACRKARKKAAQAGWLAKNPDYFKRNTHKEDCQNWRRNHQDYWQSYRQNHPGYAETNRQRQKIRDKRRLFLAKKDEIAQNPLGELESIRLLAQKSLAKKDEIRIPVEGILDFLTVKESLAKKDESLGRGLARA